MNGIERSHMVIAQLRKALAAEREVREILHGALLATICWVPEDSEAKSITDEALKAARKLIDSEHVDKATPKGRT